MTLVYIGFVGMERYDNQRLKNEELNAWIEENVHMDRRNFSKWGVNINTRPPYLVGMFLEPEQAVIYKLKFGDV
jgi:hypothetical protein